jgi:hypothetical protein
MVRNATALTLLLLGLLSTGTFAQQVRGRVVDERSRQAVPGVTVVLQDSSGSVTRDAATDATGFFVLRAPAAGTWIVLVRHPGYAEASREIRVGEGESLVPAFVLQAEAIALDSIEARARRRSPADGPGFQRASHIIGGARMAQLESRGAGIVTVVREFNGLRTREYKDPTGRNRTCIESVRRVASLGGGMQSGGTTMGNPAQTVPCAWIVIVLDDMVIDDPETTLRGLNLTHFESAEYLPPAEAGFRYGLEAGASGALVLWTRGRGPHASEDRNRER